MANTLSLTVDSITADRTQGVLLDGTTYSSPVRTGVGVFVKGQRMLSAVSVESTLTLVGNNTDPETDTQWTFNIPKDGWFRFLMVSVPDFNAATTYAIYEAVFQPSTDKVYRSKQNGNTTDTLTDTTWWEEMTDPATLASNEGEANESTNIDSLIYEPGIMPNSEYGFANEIADAAEKYLTANHIPDNDLDQYTLLGVLVDGAYVKFDRSEMNMGERITRRLESILETLEN
jgi:hypothetical protein